MNAKLAEYAVPLALPAFLAHHMFISATGEKKNYKLQEFLRVVALNISIWK
jgi:hypothetical protein